MELNISYYHNCYSIIVDAFLKRHGINKEKFWAISGLYYEKENANPVFLSPYFILWHNQFENFGINLIEKTLEDEKVFKDLAREIVMSKNQSITVVVDTYYLSYCSLYKKEHSEHVLEISKIDETERYYVYDHFFAFEGWVEYSDIDKSIWGVKKHLKERPVLFYLVLSNKIEPSFKSIIERNYESLSKRIHYPGSSSSSGVYGLNALSFIQRDIIEIMNLEMSELNIELITNYYYKVKELANSRHHMAMFFEKYKYPHLCSNYSDSHQNWLTIANILLRYIIIGNKRDVNKKIKKCIKSIRYLEGEIEDELKKILSEKGD